MGSWNPPASGGGGCQIKVTGAVEYLGEDGQVIETVSTETQCAAYLAWCREHGVRPAEQILG